jgi:hypothetical protein
VLSVGMWLCLCADTVRAEPPIAAYIFPAGGQRGTTVDVRIGGIFFHGACGLSMTGPGVTAPDHIEEIATLWFKGPHFTGKASDDPEDYPRDHGATVTIAADAPLGPRHWQTWTSQGATASRRFVVGDLPERVEREIEGDPIPVGVQLPVTINGRIFPREDVDIWTFEARAGATYTLEVQAKQLGSPLEARLVVLDPAGRRLAESLAGENDDPRIGVIAEHDGVHQVHIHDIAFGGLQPFVYRLTITTGPHVDWVYPLGGRRGRVTRFEFGGLSLPVSPVEVTLPDDPSVFHDYHVDGKTGRSRPVHLALDDLLEYVELEPNDQPEAALSIEPGSIINGRIDRPGDVDGWTFSARKETPLDLEVRAVTLGSSLHAQLTLLDRDGKEVSKHTGDGRFSFKPPQDGDYRLRITDRFESRGGPDFAYRIRVAPPPASSYRLTLGSDAITVTRGEQAKLNVSVERIGGYDVPIVLTVEGLPDGVTASESTVAGDKTSAEITLEADASTAIQARHVRVHGTAGDRSVSTPDRLLLAVAMPTPFTFKQQGTYVNFVPRGTVHRERFVIERNGYDGPITFRLSDRQRRHLQGITGPPVVIPPGTDSFTYPIHMATGMDLARTARVLVMGTAVITDPDGSWHAVSYYNQETTQSAISVAAARLDVSVAKPSITLGPDRELSLAVRVVRGQGIVGPVRVELLSPRHILGVTAQPVTVAPDQQQAQLVIRAAAQAGPFNMPLLIQAQCESDGDPVLAHAEVDVTWSADPKPTSVAATPTETN